MAENQMIQGRSRSSSISQPLSYSCVLESVSYVVEFFKQSMKKNKDIFVVFRWFVRFGIFVVVVVAIAGLFICFFPSLLVF